MSFPDQQQEPFRLADMTRPQQFGHPSTWTTSTPPFPPATYTPPAAPSRRRRWPLVAVLAALVVLIAAGAVTLYVLTRPKPPDPLSDANLITACQEAAKRQLKAPASAKFSDETTSALSETRMRVWGVVDAQNGFGAQLRERYTCEADRGDKMWLVQSVVFSAWN